jgi:spore coat polysaccharide biosynthesis protein SpsF (cytidylyltransferase family)
VTNAFPEYRTFFDGSDCEMVDRRLFAWVNREAKGHDREHVMSLLYKQRPEWCSFANLFSNFDLTDVKLSIDTEEDLKRAGAAYESVQTKTKSLVEKYGKKACHRY